jgi:hypothetical protein
MSSTVIVLYIVLFILFVLSIIGILKSDKDDNPNLFYSSAIVFILSVAGAIVLWFAATYFVVMKD